eukprot:6181974-Pleurochrysis_carterae.AAC.1
MRKFLYDTCSGCEVLEACSGNQHVILQLSLGEARGATGLIRRYCTARSFHLDNLPAGIYEEIYVYRKLSLYEYRSRFQVGIYAHCYLVGEAIA